MSFYEKIREIEERVLKNYFGNVPNDQLDKVITEQAARLIKKSRIRLYVHQRGKRKSWRKQH